MARTRTAEEVLFFCGVLAARGVPWEDVRAALVGLWGEAGPESPEFPFVCTEYYADELGPDPWRRFLSFRARRAPDFLADAKLQSNLLELELAGRYPALGARPVNLDPGYLHPAKIVLASAKDFSHRVYLRDGIYAEVTLYYQGRDWQILPWTFPDYRTKPYLDFFRLLRRYHTRTERGRVKG